MRLLLHETLTGEFVTEVPFTKVSASSGVGRADTVTVEVPGYTDFPIWQYLIPRKYTLTPVFEDGYCPAAAVAGMPEAETDKDGINKVTLQGQGIESVFERIPVLPAPFWPLINSNTGRPIVTRDTMLSGFDYGTIMKRLYQQALGHFGMPTHLRFEADRAGTRQKTFIATDGKPVQEAVNDVSNLLGGVEWDWKPTVDTRDNLTIDLVTADDTIQELIVGITYQWNSSGNDPDIGPITITVSPEFFCSTAIFMGGKGGTDGAGTDGNRVLASRALNSEIVDKGVPAHFVWDTSHSSVSDQSTLDGWAARRALEGGAPVQYWKFKVRASSAPGLRHGMMVDLLIEDHWFIPDGVYSRRVVEISWSTETYSDPEWFDVVVAGELAW